MTSTQDTREIDVARRWLREKGEAEQERMASDAEVVEMLETTYPGGSRQFRADHIARPTDIPTSSVMASDLAVGDLVRCGAKFREVLAIRVRSEDGGGEPTELYVSVSDRHRQAGRRLILTADLTVQIRDRQVKISDLRGKAV